MHSILVTGAMGRRGEAERFFCGAPSGPGTASGGPNFCPSTSLSSLRVSSFLSIPLFLLLSTLLATTNSLSSLFKMSDRSIDAQEKGMLGGATLRRECGSLLAMHTQLTRLVSFSRRRHFWRVRLLHCWLDRWGAAAHHFDRADTPRIVLNPRSPLNTESSATQVRSCSLIRLRRAPFGTRVARRAGWMHRPRGPDPFFSPAPLGLCAFALTTFVLSLVNVGAHDVVSSCSLHVCAPFASLHFRLSRPHRTSSFPSLFSTVASSRCSPECGRWHVVRLSAPPRSPLVRLSSPPSEGRSTHGTVC